ncbi:unnamed protein product [Mytilus edulis]|uniref:PDZ domain-containing protein n=1 Tax=Mytilus edulis TaxID=6550 RepID=A0A8S3SBQ1_MYTED|nr:unnamed protein product [Mytilus edulis]
MPAATTDSQETALDCLHDLRSQLDDIGDRTGARDADLDFLKSFLTDPVVQKIAQADDELKLPMSNPPSDVRGEKLLADVNNVIQKVVGTANGRDLDEILSDPHIGALMKAYDDVADKNYEEELYETNKLAQPPPPVFSAVADHVRLVSIKKDKTTSLGITVKIDENFNLRIARVLAGSVIDKQGMLHVNDIIKEVNGIPVATPEQLMDIIRVAESEITFKIVPTMQDINFKTQKVVGTANGRDLDEILSDPHIGGITVKIDENFNLRIARVLAGSVIDKQGMLHVNDIIKEVNGIPISHAEQLMDIIRVVRE